MTALRREGGFATVVTLGLSACLLLAGAAAAAVAEAVVTRARAAAAADAGALAAASAVATGAGEACAAASSAAARDGAVLRRCTVVGAVATVEVQVEPVVWLRWAGSARLNARAGPADPTIGTKSDEPASVDPAS